MGGPTASSTLNGSEWPRDAAVCSLSDVLETSDVPPRYFLSQKACAGIIRRAERRGKELPTMLRRALEQVAVDLNKREKPEDKTQLLHNPSGEAATKPTANTATATLGRTTATRGNKAAS